MAEPKLWTAGSNAFKQLFRDREDDLWEFESLEPSHASPSINNNGPDLFYTGWSSTALSFGSDIVGIGFQTFTAKNPIAGEDTFLKCPFGNDQDGLLGCLDSEGKVYLLVDSDSSDVKTFSPSGGPEAPPVSNVAIAGNDRVAVTFKQAPNARLTHVAEFLDFASFKKWHNNPSDSENYPLAHHMLPGRPKELVANGGNFIMLMEEGEVYTWGDPRFRTLARPTAGPDAVPADKPGIVEALGGLKIASVQCGPGVGWLASALSGDGALYLWGGTTPGEDGAIACLQEAGPGEVALVEVTPSHGAEPADIISAGVGRNHVAVVTDAGHLYVVGDNGNGQLGLGKASLFENDWTRVPSLSDLRRAVAGPKSTFAFSQ